MAWVRLRSLKSLPWRRSKQQAITHAPEASWLVFKSKNRESQFAGRLLCLCTSKSLILIQIEDMNIERVQRAYFHQWPVVNFFEYIISCIVLSSSQQFYWIIQTHRFAVVHLRANFKQNYYGIRSVWWATCWWHRVTIDYGVFRWIPHRQDTALPYPLRVIATWIRLGWRAGKSALRGHGRKLQAGAHHRDSWTI